MYLDTTVLSNPNTNPGQAVDAV